MLVRVGSRSSKLMRWIEETFDAVRAERLTNELGISPLLARLLVLRGINEPDAAHAFLHPSLDQLHSPNLMPDMNAAVTRLRQAIEKQEKILIYGDYDVDGSMAVVVLLTALRMLKANVEHFIPDRFVD